MNQLYIPESKRTPEIKFELNGVFSIKGRSIPEDASKFYGPLSKWICEYANTSNRTTTLSINLEYFNSGSAKALLQVIKLIAGLRSTHGHEVVINWYYENGDDDILERGQYYSSILNLNFNFFEV